MTHPAHVQLKRPVQAAVLTVSDTRTAETDHGGQMLRQLTEQAGYIVVDSHICKDAIDDIREKLKEWLRHEAIDVILTTGGSGIAKHDVTVEAIRPLLEKEMSGFGEYFRWLSLTEDVGTRAMASRALAGTSCDKVLFVLPGSISAVKLAMRRLILPELEHVVYEATKHKLHASRE